MYVGLLGGTSWLLAVCLWSMKFDHFKWMVGEVMCWKKNLNWKKEVWEVLLEVFFLYCDVIVDSFPKSFFW